MIHQIDSIVFLLPSFWMDLWECIGSQAAIECTGLFFLLFGFWGSAPKLVKTFLLHTTKPWHANLAECEISPLFGMSSDPMSQQPSEVLLCEVKSFGLENPFRGVQI